MRAAILPALALWLASCAAAWAHPHVWVDYHAAFVFDSEGRVTAIRERWRFDEMFSTAVIADFDSDHDKAFSSKETAKLKTGAFDNMKDYGYFTHLWVDGVKQTLAAPVDFGASIDGGRLVYTFTLPLPAPVDPARRTLGLIVVDQDFFIDIQLADDDPVEIRGPKACGFTVVADAEHDVWGTPSKRIDLTCPAPSRP